MFYSILAYIVNHSQSYTIAAIASWVEFWVEYSLLGRWKVWWLISALGVMLVLLGQVSGCLLLSLSILILCVYIVILHTVLKQKLCRVFVAFYMYSVKINQIAIVVVIVVAAEL